MEFDLLHRVFSDDSEPGRGKCAWHFAVVLSQQIIQHRAAIIGRNEDYVRMSESSISRIFVPVRWNKDAKNDGFPIDGCLRLKLKRAVALALSVGNQKQKIN